jgi:hypothetical protein
MTHYLQDGWIYSWLSFAFGVGQIASRAYRLQNTGFPIFRHSGNLKGYHYHNQRGNFLSEFDYPHGNIDYNHFHGWFIWTMNDGKN